MKKFNFISMLLVALLCSANMWGVPVEITPENPYTNSFDTETTYAVPTGWTKVAGNTYNPGITQTVLIRRLLTQFRQDGLK